MRQLLLTQNSLGTTYQTLQHTLVEGDVEGLQDAAHDSSGLGSTLLMVGIVIAVAIACIIETGSFIGLVLPSAVVVLAAVLALSGLGYWWMVIVVIVVAIAATFVGDWIGYSSGYKLGSQLYQKKDTWYFKKKYLLKAQEALMKSGGKILYTGRYTGIGSVLPTMYGMMQRDKKEFFFLSVSSSIIHKLSIIIPLIILIVLFPGLKNQFALLLILAAVIPEVVGRILLLKPQAEKYLERLVSAQEQILAIRQNLKDIGNQVGTIVTQLKTPTEQQALEAQQSLEAELKLEEQKKLAQALHSSEKQDTDPHSLSAPSTPLKDMIGLLGYLTKKALRPPSDFQKKDSGLPGVPHDTPDHMPN